MRLLILLLAGLASAQVAVNTAHYDNTRDGVNSSEIVLTPANVSGLQNTGTLTVDGAIFSQVLFATRVVIAGLPHNLIIVSTMNNSVYAFDSISLAQIWKRNLGATATSAQINSITLYGGQVGIASTPVIDSAGGFLYVVSVNATPIYTLYQLSLATGAVVNSVAISGAYPGTGAGTVNGWTDNTSGGNVLFTPAWESQRTPLTLANGNVYFGFGSGDEDHIWHGWTFAYNASTLAQVSVLCLSPNGNGAGVWEAGGGMAVDASGNLYFATGNGDWDGTSNFGQSVMKVSPSLVVLDYGTPANWASTDSVDADVSSGRVMLIGNTFITVGTKDGRAWLYSTSNLGQLQGSGPGPTQVFTIFNLTPGNATGVYGGLFFLSNAYFPIAGHPVFGFTYSAGSFTTTAFASTSNSFSQVAAAGTSNAGSNGILWFTTVTSSPFSSMQAVTLHAVNPATLVDLWTVGPLNYYAKFSQPTIANGVVYLPLEGGTVQVYGLPGSVLGSGTSIGGNIAK